MKPQEHLSEGARIAAAAEAKSREPNQQQFDIAPWLKAHVHATLALAGAMADLADAMQPRELVVEQFVSGPPETESE